jgi:hypothetical protein
MVLFLSIFADSAASRCSTPEAAFLLSSYTSLAGCIFLYILAPGVSRHWALKRRIFWILLRVHWDEGALQKACLVFLHHTLIANTRRPGTRRAQYGQ